MTIKRKIIPTPMGDKCFYVYEYSYPRGFISDDGVDLSDIVFYVGKGTVARKGIQRVDIHEHEANARDWNGKWTNRINVICGIWARGMTPNKRVVFESNDELTVLLFEVSRIKERRSSYLTNVKETMSTCFSSLLKRRDYSRKPKPRVSSFTWERPERTHPIYTGSFWDPEWM